MVQQLFLTLNSSVKLLNYQDRIILLRDKNEIDFMVYLYAWIFENKTYNYQVYFWRSCWTKTEMYVSKQDLRIMLVVKH